MKRTLEYYLALKYEVRLRPIPEEEGGGCCATIPELGDLTFVAEGESEQEAIDNLESLRREVFTELYRQGKDIPLPKTEEDFSGKFVVRIPKFLHRELYLRAKEESVSLNQLVVALLTRAFYSLVTGRAGTEDVQRSAADEPAAGSSAESTASRDRGCASDLLAALDVDLRPLRRNGAFEGVGHSG